CRLDSIGDLEGVRAWYLIHRDDSRRLAVVAADGVVQHGPQLEASDVLESHLGSVRIRTKDDVPEFFLIQQPSLGADRIGVLGAGRRRRTTNLSGRSQL